MDIRWVLLVCAVATAATLCSGAPYPDQPDDALLVAPWPAYGEAVDADDMAPDYEEEPEDMEPAASSIVFRPLFRYRQIVAQRRKLRPSSSRRRGTNRRKNRNPYYYY